MDERVFYRDVTEINSLPGETFILELEGQPTAGYEWRLEPGDSGVDFEELDATQDADGIGGTSRQRFRIHPRFPGVSTIVLEYGRPWEIELVETKTVTLRVAEEEGR